MKLALIAVGVYLVCGVFGFMLYRQLKSSVKSVNLVKGWNKEEI